MIKQSWVVAIQFVIASAQRRDAFKNGDVFQYEMGPVVNVQFTTEGGFNYDPANESGYDVTRRSNRHVLFLKARKHMTDDVELSRKYPRDRFVAVGYITIKQLQGAKP